MTGMGMVAFHHGPQQLRQRFLVLQLSQSRCVRRTYIDYEVIDVRMERIHACEVIFHRFVVGRDLVLPNVPADHESLGTADQTPGSRVQSVVVESHAVEDAAVLFQSKQPGLGVATLGTWGKGADLHKPKPKHLQRRQPARVLVEARRQSDGVGKRQTRHRHLASFVAFCRTPLHPPRHSRDARREHEKVHGGVVRTLRRHQEKQGFEDFFVHGAKVIRGPAQPPTM